MEAPLQLTQDAPIHEQHQRSFHLPPLKVGAHAQVTKVLCLDRLVPPCGAHEIELDIESVLWQVDECVIDCWPLLECAFCVFHWAVLISTAWRHPHEVATLFATDVCIAFVEVFHSASTEFGFRKNTSVAHGWASRVTYAARRSSIMRPAATSARTASNTCKRSKPSPSDSLFEHGLGS